MEAQRNQLGDFQREFTNAKAKKMQEVRQNLQQQKTTELNRY